MRDLAADWDIWDEKWNGGSTVDLLNWLHDAAREAIDRAIKAEAEVERLRSLVNLCDICINRIEIPVCIPDDVEFGCGLGNDNIIKCRSFREIEKDRGTAGLDDGATQDD